MTDQTKPAQTPTEYRAGFLVQLEREQALVDEAQAAYDVAHEKSTKAWQEAQRKYSMLQTAKERRDAALAELQSALPKPDPDPMAPAVEG